MSGQWQMEDGFVEYEEERKEWYESWKVLHKSELGPS